MDVCSRSALVRDRWWPPQAHSSEPAVAQLAKWRLSTGSKLYYWLYFAPRLMVFLMNKNFISNF